MSVKVGIELLLRDAALKSRLMYAEVSKFCSSRL